MAAALMQTRSIPPDQVDPEDEAASIGRAMTQSAIARCPDRGPSPVGRRI